MTTLPPLAPAYDPLAQDDRTDASLHPDWDAVARARTRTIDAKAGFETMSEHAEPDFAPIVAAFLELHTRHAEAFTLLLSEAGHAPDQDGSLMGTVNRMVVATRAFFDDIDADVLTQIHSGETSVAEAYEEALAAHLPAGAHDKIASLLAELRELMADTRPIA